MKGEGGGWRVEGEDEGGGWRVRVRVRARVWGEREGRGRGERTMMIPNDQMSAAYE